MDSPIGSPPPYAGEEIGGLGPVSRRLPRRLALVTLLAIAAPLSPAFAEVCDKARPNWTGEPVSAFAELMNFIYTTPGLIVAGVLAVVLLTRLRYTAIAGAAIALGLAGLAIFEHFSPDEIGRAARAEGCVGSPWLVVVVLTLCALLMMFFARPRQGR